MDSGWEKIEHPEAGPASHAQHPRGPRSRTQWKSDGIQSHSWDYSRTRTWDYGWAKGISEEVQASLRETRLEPNAKHQTGGSWGRFRGYHLLASAERAETTSGHEEHMGPTPTKSSLNGSSIALQSGE